MKVLNITQNTEEWLEARKGKITGSTLKDIVTKRGTGKKIGFYQLIADRIAVDADGEDVMDRGHRLEEQARALFEKTYKVKLDTPGMWIADFNDAVAISPDAVVVGEPWAVEIKCLNSARHIQAIIENKIPSDYEEQITQYFIVNEELKRVSLVFYDPRIASKPFHVVNAFRKDYEDDIKMLKDYEIKTLEEVDYWVERLAF